MERKHAGDELCETLFVRLLQTRINATKCATMNLYIYIYTMKYYIVWYDNNYYAHRGPIEQNRRRGAKTNACRDERFFFFIRSSIQFKGSCEIKRSQLIISYSLNRFDYRLHSNKLIASARTKYDRIILVIIYRMHLLISIVCDMNACTFYHNNMFANYIF